MNVRLNNFLIIEFVLLFNHPGYCFCIQHDDELIHSFFETLDKKGSTFISIYTNSFAIFGEWKLS